MNRDHFLFLVIGLLTGFLGGYIAHEMMAAVQPPPLSATATPEASGDPHAGLGTPATPVPQVADINRLRAVLEQDPENRDALLTLANLNFDIGAWDRAVELYQRYLTLDSSNPDVLTDLGIALRSLGRPDEALERFREANRLRPDHWQSLFNEAVVHAFDRSDFAAAEAALERLRQIAPGNPDVARLAQEIESRRTAG